MLNLQSRGAQLQQFIMLRLQSRIVLALKMLLGLCELLLRLAPQLAFLRDLLLEQRHRPSTRASSSCISIRSTIFTSILKLILM